MRVEFSVVVVAVAAVAPAIIMPRRSDVRLASQVAAQFEFAELLSQLAKWNSQADSWFQLVESCVSRMESDTHITSCMANWDGNKNNDEADDNNRSIPERGAR